MIFQTVKIIIVGASIYKSAPLDLNIGELNLKVAKNSFKKYSLPLENIIIKTGYSYPCFLEVNLRYKFFKVNINGKEEII